MVGLVPLPSQAGWHHRGARDGFEVVIPEQSDGGGHRLRGATSAVESGRAWTVRYDVITEPGGATRRAVVRTEDVSGVRAVSLDRGVEGGWRVDGVERADLGAAVDVDLEASLVTNTLPVHRLIRAEGLLLGGPAVSAPAAFVGLDDTVSLLDQTYALLEAGPDGLVLAYACPAFEVDVVLRLDPAALVVDYPGLGVRHT